MEKQKKAIKILDCIATIWTSSIIILWLLCPETGILLKFRNLFKLYTILPPIFYLILRKVIVKENVLFRNKFDIGIHAFFLTMLFPLMFNTYISLGDTLEYILRYGQVLLIYNVVKNICINRKNIQLIINIILASIVFVFLWGIDSQTNDLIDKFLNITKSSIRTEYTTFSFCYGYHNTLFIIMASGVILSQYKLIESNRNVIYSMILMVCQTGLILAFSRAGLVVFFLIELIIFGIIIKYKISKRNLLIFISNFIIASIFSEIFTTSFSYFTASILWIILLICLLITAIITQIINKLKRFNIKFKFNKIWVYFVVAILVISSFILLVSIRISAPIEINNDTKDEIYKRMYTIHDAKKCQMYTIDMDYCLPNDGINCTYYAMHVFGVTNSGKYDLIKSVNFGNYLFYEPVSIYFDEKYIELKIGFECITECENALTINNVFINGKEQILNYKYYPDSIDYLLNSFTLKNVSLNERINIYSDSLKYSLKNKFIGSGGMTWKHIFKSNQSYTYYTTEVHSRVFEILLNCGGIGMIVYFAIIIIYTFEILKLDKKHIIFALIPALIVIHAGLDWTLSQDAPLVLLYVILAVISSIIPNIKMEKMVIINISELIFFIIFSIMCIYYCYCYFYASNLYNKEIEKDVAFYMYEFQLIPHGQEYKKEKIRLYELDCIENKEELLNELEYLIKYERNSELSTYLRRYLELSKICDYQVAENLVKKSIKYLYVDHIYDLNSIQQYIEDLDQIRLYICDYEDMDKSVNMITQKIRFEYDRMLENLKCYDKFPMKLGLQGNIDENNMQDVELLVENLKVYY